MANPKPWLKMWAEWPNDPKMVKLNLSEIGAWWEVVTLAHNCNNEGRLTTGNGRALTIEEIMDNCRVKTPADLRAFNSMMDKMTNEASLHWEDDTLVVTNYVRRQERVPSESKEAVKDRVRRFRERKAGLPPKNPPLYIEGEGEGESNSVTPVTSNGKPVTSEPALARIATLHEQYFGIITPVLSEKFKSFVENYRGPVEWIDLAFAEAVQLKNRRWAYVEAILYSWQEKGGPHADRREPGAEGQRPGADQRDIIAEARAGGWEVLGVDEPETAEAGNQD